MKSSKSLNQSDEMMICIPIFQVNDECVDWRHSCGRSTSRYPFQIHLWLWFACNITKITLVYNMLKKSEMVTPIGVKEYLERMF